MAIRLSHSVRQFRLRALAVAALTAVLVASGVATASAANAPVNDSWQEATSVSAGQTVTLDTTAATSTDEEDGLPFCYREYAAAMVWFKVTVPADGTYELDTSGSGYPTGQVSFKTEVEPWAGNLFDCQGSLTTFRATAGEVFLFGVYSRNGVGGGNLSLTLTRLPEATMTMTLGRTAQLTRHRTVRLAGTYTCQNLDFAYQDVTLRQQDTRGQMVYGSALEVAMLPLICDGAKHAWAVTVRDNLRFTAGQAQATLTYQAASRWGLAQGSRLHPVTIRKQAGRVDKAAASGWPTGLGLDRGPMR